MNQEELVQKLDALRPHSDDLRQLADDELREQLATDPEAKRLFERLEQLDAGLTAVFLDVDAPEGLEQRLLAQLTDAAPDDAAQPVELPARDLEAEAPEDHSGPAAARPSARRLRRWHLIAGALALAASLLGVMFYPWDGGGSTVGVEDLLNQAINAYRQDRQAPAQSVAQNPAPSRYQISPLVNAGREPRWRQVDEFLGFRAIAYELRLVNGAEATVYVVHARFAALPSDPYSQRPLPTGGLWATAWQEDQLAYFLVAKGGNRHDDPLRYFPEFANAHSLVCAIFRSFLIDRSRS